MPAASRSGHPGETASMLMELARSSRTGLIVSLPLAATYACRVVGASGDGFDLEVTGEADDVFEPLSLALVTLPFGAHVRAFFSHVRSARRTDPRQPLTVQLHASGELASMPVRLAHRTPLVADHGLEVAIETGPGAGTRIDPVDISPGGIGIRFEPSEDPRLARGQVVQLRLGYGGTSVRLEGIVKHTDGNGRYGLLFSTAASNDGSVPAPEFQRMVAGVQRHWLRHRSA